MQYKKYTNIDVSWEQRSNEDKTGRRMSRGEHTVAGAGGGPVRELNPVSSRKKLKLYAYVKQARFPGVTEKRFSKK